MAKKRKHIDTAINEISRDSVCLRQILQRRNKGGKTMGFQGEKKVLIFMTSEAAAANTD